LYGFGLLTTAATSAEVVGYRLELGVPAEIDIDAAVPALRLEAGRTQAL
jgi:hypothetical protein